jgi:hypothetical protein
MRYLLLTYVTRPSGKIDEVMTIAKRTQTLEIGRTTNVILDFLDQRVLLCSVAGTQCQQGLGYHSFILLSSTMPQP